MSGLFALGAEIALGGNQRFAKMPRPHAIDNHRAASGAASEKMSSASSSRPEPCRNVVSPFESTVRKCRGSMAPGAATLACGRMCMSRATPGLISIVVRSASDPLIQTPASNTDCENGRSEARVAPGPIAAAPATGGIRLRRCGYNNSRIDGLRSRLDARSLRRIVQVVPHFRMALFQESHRIPNLIHLFSERRRFYRRFFRLGTRLIAHQVREITEEKKSAARRT